MGFGKIVLGCWGCLWVMSCTLYKTTPVHTPMLTDQGEFVLNTQLTAGLYNTVSPYELAGIQAAFAPTNKIGIIGGFDSRYLLVNDTSYFRMASIGVGAIDVYSLGENSEIYGGYAFGRSGIKIDDLSRVNNINLEKADVHKYFLLYNILLGSNYQDTANYYRFERPYGQMWHEIILSLQLAKADITNIRLIRLDPDNAVVSEGTRVKESYLKFEPFLSFTLGKGMMSFRASAGMSMNILQNASPVFQPDIHALLSVGFGLLIDQSVLNKRRH